MSDVCMYLTRLTHGFVSSVGSLVGTEAEVDCSHRGVSLDCRYVLAKLQVP